MKRLRALLLFVGAMLVAALLLAIEMPIAAVAWLGACLAATSAYHHYHLEAFGRWAALPRQRPLPNGFGPWRLLLDRVGRFTRQEAAEREETAGELERLRMVSDDAARADWQALVEQAEGLMRSQVAPGSDAAKAFALRWLQTFERDTGGDARLAAKLNVMAKQEHEKVGMPAPLLGYVMAAVGGLKFDAWAKYLPPEVLDLLRYGRGVDNRRLKRAGFRYRYTSAGAVERFWQGLRLRRTLGSSEPEFTYDPDVETFFRHSPAVHEGR